MATVIFLLPAQDFDPSEVAVSWRILTQQGHQVLFATPEGLPAVADLLMLNGEGLDFWGFLPGLRKAKLLGLALRANSEARSAYAQMEADARFAQPLAYGELATGNFDALLLPGGHRARGMRPFMESPVLHRFVADFFDSGKPVAAICHGVLLAARSRSATTGKSVLFGRRTTALTWKFERSAWHLMKYAGRFWNPDYYRTYVEAPGETEAYWSVEAEVKRALKSPADFLDVPSDSAHHFRKSSGLFRDSPTDARPAFVVQDGNYISARWPGDVHSFALTFAQLLGRQIQA